jgi:hypothetical protein
MPSPSPIVPLELPEDRGEVSAAPAPVQPAGVDAVSRPGRLKLAEALVVIAEQARLLEVARAQILALLEAQAPPPRRGRSTAWRYAWGAVSGVVEASTEARARAAIRQAHGLSWVPNGAVVERVVTHRSPTL